MMQKRARVLIYLPFYSGECESRHARMHDLIQSLDDRGEDLPFEFTIIAERGRSTNSKNILYAKFPFLKRYTTTYTIPKASGDTTKKQSDTLKTKQAPIEPSNQEVDPTKNINNGDHTPSSKTSVNLGLKRDSETPPHHETSELSEGKNTPEISKTIISRLILSLKIPLLFSFKALRKAIQLVKQLFRQLKKRIQNLARKSIKAFSVIAQLRSGTAYSIVWKWCRDHAVSNTGKIGAIDIFHIVRPNATSDRMIEKLRAKNPEMKVIIGPNLMAYGPPSNGFDFEEFAQKKIDRVLAISSYHSRLLNEFGFSKSKIIRLPPSVNPNHFSPPIAKEEAQTKRKFTIIFAASQLSVEKGALDFLNAINKLENDKKIDFKAIMIGGFEVNAGVQTPVQEDDWNKASKAITFAGKVTRANMQQYYQDADVFVHTGEPENGPTTIIEALSCGTSCILPNHECFKEPEFTQGVHYYEKGNTDQLLKHIYYVAEASNINSSRFLPATTHQQTIDFISELYKRVDNESIK